MRYSNHVAARSSLANPPTAVPSALDLSALSVICSTPPLHGNVRNAMKK